MLRLAVSNIAWRPEESQQAYGLLADHGVKGLEIAPGLLLHDAIDPFGPTEVELRNALAPVQASGLELVSMQSLLFGVDGAALFGDGEALSRFTGGLRRAIRLAGRLGIPNLVMGSPRQREIPPGMDYAAAETLALEVFGELGDFALAQGTRLGMEANPAAYGTNFLVTLQEAAAFVDRLNHPAVTLTLDVGELKMNNEFANLDGLAARFASLISHVHLSEPHLAPSPAAAEEVAHVMTALSEAGYDGWFSIEMKMLARQRLEGLASAVGRLVKASSICRRRLPV